MTESLIQGTTEVTKLAQELREMADRMEKNADGNFGGAFVVIDPAGNVVKTLIIDSKQDAAQFWSILKTKCDMALGSLDEAIRQSRGFR